MNRYRLISILGILISIFFLYLAIKDTNFSEIRDGLSRSRYWIAIPLLTTLALFYWIKAVRWRVLLDPIRETTTREILPAMMIGFAGNNLLPAHLGEFLRMYVIAKQFGLSKTSVLATIVIERMFDFLTVLFLLAGILLVDTKVPPSLVTAGYFIAVAGLGLLALVVVYITRTEAFVSFFRRRLRVLPRTLQTKLIRQAELGALGLNAIREPHLLFGVIGTSLVQWMLMGICLYTGILAVGISVPLSSAFVLLALSVAALTLPSSPGFFGTIELCFVLSLEPYGVSQGDAFAAAIFYHLLAYLSVTATGLYYLKRLGSTLGRLKKDAEAIDETVK